MSIQELRTESILEETPQISLSTEFPYDEMNRIVKESRRNKTDFYIALSMYFADLTGYFSRQKKIMQWSEQDIETANEFVQTGFFEKYPKYSGVAKRITPDNTPELYKYMVYYEQVRQKLLRTLSIANAGNSTG